MIAANFNIIVDRASDWSIVLYIKDATGAAIDVSSNEYTFRGSVQNKTTKIDDAVFTITKTNGANGIVTISLSDTLTRKLFETQKYTYDIFMSSNAVTLPALDTRLLEGTLTVRNNSTN